MDWKHAEGSLHRDETAQPAVAALQFLAGEPVHDIAHPGGTVTLEMHAKHPQAGELGNDLHGKGGALEMLGHNR